MASVTKSISKTNIPPSHHSSQSIFGSTIAEVNIDLDMKLNTDAPMFQDSLSKISKTNSKISATSTNADLNTNNNNSKFFSKSSIGTNDYLNNTISSLKKLSLSNGSKTTPIIRDTESIDSKSPKVIRRKSRQPSFNSQKTYEKSILSLSQNNLQQLLPLEVDISIVDENEKIQRNFNLRPNETRHFSESTELNETPIFVDVNTKLVKNLDSTRCRIIGYEYRLIDDTNDYLAKQICETEIELPNEQKDKTINMSNDDYSLITISINRSSI